MRKISSLLAVMLLSLTLFLGGCASKSGQSPEQTSTSIGTFVKVAVYETLLQVEKAVDDPAQVTYLEGDFMYISTELMAVSAEGINSNSVLEVLSKGFERINERFKFADEKVQIITRNLPMIGLIIDGYFKTYELSENAKLYIDSIAKGFADGVADYELSK